MSFFTTSVTGLKTDRMKNFTLKLKIREPEWKRRKF